MIVNLSMDTLALGFRRKFSDCLSVCPAHAIHRKFTLAGKTARVQLDFSIARLIVVGTFKAGLRLAGWFWCGAGNGVVDKSARQFSAGGASAPAVWCWACDGAHDLE